MTTTATILSPHRALTMADLRKAQGLLDAIPAPQKYDRVLLTTRQRCELEHAHSATAGPHTPSCESILGIPVESFSYRSDLLARARALAARGKRVLTMEDEQCTS
ncbi:MAG: hypothetical protein GY851_35630 [bacterium]|nr:hypothetical protein [bacterium]